MSGLTFTDELKIESKRKIAEGGMATVYEAVLHGPEGFEKTVCIKKIKSEFTNDPEFVARFVAEAKLVADLVHQNIVQIYKLGKTGNEFYIMMEYVHGVNLHEFINKHIEAGINIPVDLTAFIISRVCRGMEYAHAKRDKWGEPLGIVHRDISPRNIMISSEGEVKIADFGVAKASFAKFEDETQTIVGKLAYMSPEQAEFKQTDRRSDIYSLGLVFYELLTLQRPCDLPTNTQLALDKIKNFKTPSPRSINRAIPEELERIVMKAIEKDIEKRYQDAGKLGYDLEYFMYHKGYGPTIQTLENYMVQLFPNLYKPKAETERYLKSMG